MDTNYVARTLIFHSTSIAYIISLTFHLAELVIEFYLDELVLNLGKFELNFTWPS